MSEWAEIATAQINRSVEPLAAEWDELADRVAADPFSRPGWLAAWWRAFGEGTLELITVRRNGRLAGVLPLGRRRGVLSSTANYHSPSFGPVAEDQMVRRELFEQALLQCRGRLELRLLLRAEPTLAEWEAAAAEHGLRVLMRTQQRTPAIEVNGEWEPYLAGLSRKFRKELNRHRRRIEGEHEVEVECANGTEGLPAYLERAFALEGAGWKRARGTALLSRPETRRFYEEIAAWAAGRDMLRIFFLRLDGEAVATDLTIQHAGIRYMLKGGFDDRYGHLSPGTVLLEAGLREAFASGLARVELGGGEDRYKLRWTDRVCERALLQAFPPTPRGFAHWAAFAYGRPIAKRLLATRLRRS